MPMPMPMPMPMLELSADCLSDPGWPPEQAFVPILFVLQTQPGVLSGGKVSEGAWKL